MEAFLSHPVVAVVILLGALVFVHELGHFLVGRWCGIAVEAFSIGFGPVVLSFKRGVTEYRLSAVPLGGYVKFYGAVPAESVPDAARGQEFFRASYLRRMATVAAGPLANFLLAAVAFAVLGRAGIPHPPASVGDVLPGGAAEAAGVYPGDRVVSIDGAKIQRWRELETSISRSAGRRMHWVLDRDGSQVEIDVTPAQVETENILGRKTRIGRAGVSLGIVPARVAVIGGDSIAAKSGMHTGDEVVSLQCAGSAEIKVTGFGDLAIKAHKLALECPDKIQLGLRRAGAELNLAMNIPPGRRPAATAGPGSPFSLFREYLKALGIDDAQLVISAENIVAPFESGDRLILFKGQPVKGVFGLRDMILENQEPRIQVTVERNFSPLQLDVNLKGIDTQQAKGKVVVYTLPVQLMGTPGEPEPVVEKYGNWLSAFAFGFAECWRQTATLSEALLHLVSGEIPLKALGGPIMIAKVAGDSAKIGWQAFLSSLALISVNLGLVNLVPIPVLDGGQMVLFSIEAVRRRPLGERAMEAFHRLGFVLVAALVILATYNDFSRFWKSMLAALVGEGN
jgi:regulator of sigma E protease